MKVLKTILTYGTIITSITLYACQPRNQSSTDASDRQDFITYLDSTGTIVMQTDSIEAIHTDDRPDVQILNPAVSPDGQQIAYTKITEQNDDRTVALIDLATRKTTTLNVPSKNFYGPVWSPNAQLIAVNIFNKNSHWKIGIIERKNKGYKMLDSLSSIDYYAPTWKGNDQIVAHNMETLYTLNVNGKIIDSVGFSDLFSKDYSLSSSDCFYFSKDGKKLFFNVGNNDPLPQLMGPSEALYELNLPTKEIKRLSPPGVNVSRIFVSPDDRVFYEGSTTPFKIVQLFEIDSAGRVKLLAKQGSSISVAPNAIKPNKQI